LLASLFIVRFSSLFAKSFFKKKVEIPIGETTMIVNEYLRNHSKPMLSWSSVLRFIAPSECMKLGKRGTKKDGKTDPDLLVAKMKVPEKSREERQRPPRTRKARRRRWLLGANLVSAKAPKVAGCLEEKSVTAVPKAAPRPKGAPAASSGPIGIEE
jgi:hypothetical protein